ncbi:hypothetical protein E2C01_075189 [Portunus trituberculatus]|uniref:Uncharacterized protein n=1 Tax=Portunus trituberculatus TaxID=210409 RepID=A0A5B7IF66_PORTR|nr:hypothetical protein [Portunus trituberculatus]
MLGQDESKWVRMGVVVHVFSEAEGSGLGTESEGRDWNMEQIRIRTQIYLCRDEELGELGQAVTGRDLESTSGREEKDQAWLARVHGRHAILKEDKVFAQCPIWSCIDVVP